MSIVNNLINCFKEEAFTLQDAYKVNPTVKNMATVEELKNIIVDLRVDLINANIPNGHCPYAYYSKSKQKDRENCDNIDCDVCRRKFLKDKEEDIRVEVAAL